MEFERGPTWDLLAYEPCPACGIRDADMRNPDTKIPLSPPPVMAEGWQCLGCLAKGHKDKELSEGYLGEPPPGIHVRLVPYKPSEPDEEAPKSIEDDA